MSLRAISQVHGSVTPACAGMTNAWRSFYTSLCKLPDRDDCAFWRTAAGGCGTAGSAHLALELGDAGAAIGAALERVLQRCQPLFVGAQVTGAATALVQGREMLVNRHVGDVQTGADQLAT